MTLPRFSEDAERSVVSSALLDPQSVFGGEVAISVSDYYSPVSRAILEAAKGILESGGSIDSVSVGQRLLSNGKLDAIGGIPKLAEYFDLDKPLGDPVRNARIVADLARVRRGVDLARTIQATGQTCEDVSQWLSGACGGFLELCAGDLGNRVTTSTLDAMLATECEAITRRSEGEVFGVRTGIRALDRFIKGGLEDGCVYFVAGRPGMGKTSLGWQFAEAAAYDGFGSAFISLEMTREQLARRVICGDTGIDRGVITSGALSPAQWSEIAKSRARLGRLPIAVDDSPAKDYRDIRAAVQRCQRRLQTDKNFTGRFRMVVVDYLQLMRGGDGKKNREQEVADNSAGLCALAKHLECPIVVLSQLNRSVESRNDKRPLMSDLRESGATEQDATGIFMVYRPAYYERKEQESQWQQTGAATQRETGEVAEIIIRKARNGETGTVNVAFDPSRTRFSDLPSPDDGFDDMFDKEAQWPRAD